MLQDLEEGKLQNIDFLAMLDGNTEVTLNSQWMQHLQVSLHVLSGGSLSRVRLVCQQQVCIGFAVFIVLLESLPLPVYACQHGLGCCRIGFPSLSCMQRTTRQQDTGWVSA